MSQPGDPDSSVEAHRASPVTRAGARPARPRSAAPARVRVVLGRAARSMKPSRLARTSLAEKYRSPRTSMPLLKARCLLISCGSDDAGSWSDVPTL